MGEGEQPMFLVISSLSRRRRGFPSYIVKQERGCLQDLRYPTIDAREGSDGNTRDGYES